jgi:hypothetical protein
VSAIIVSAESAAKIAADSAHENIWREISMYQSANGVFINNGNNINGIGNINNGIINIENVAACNTSSAASMA